MRNKTIILVAALAFTFTPLVKAADADAKARRPGAGGGAAGRLGAGIEGLDLNEEQKSKLQEFMQENRSKMEALRDATPEERREKYQKLQESVAAKMKEVLTKEQFEKWEKNRPTAGGALAGGREKMQKLMEDLNLSDDQKEKYRNAMQEQMQSMQGLRDASPEERREKYQKMQETMSGKMKEILNKEQFEKWDKARAEMGGRLGGGGAPDGAPKKKRPSAN